MHGRVKVRTTEEERERKKREQILKVKAYKAAMAKIQVKRRNQELDDEMLQLTSQILLRNPDVLTLWNIRRECVLHKIENDEEKSQVPFEVELSLSEQCLMVNPKSYGAWHHRCWTLEHSPHPDWKQEVRLCDKYLKLDERNFHTWDYRRYVISKAGVSKQDELDFCTKKIVVNFSNYSSWHYRSNLLPALYPYEGNANPKWAMSESKIKEELEMVLTAAFTDPTDSSAWFYQRWLIGYSRPDLEICAFRIYKDKAVVAFTNPIPLNNATKIRIHNQSNQEEVSLTNWTALNDTSVDSAWICKSPANQSFDFSAKSNFVLLTDISSISKKELPLKTFNDSLYYFSPPNRSAFLSSEVLTELQSQLESCNSLLEYEPDSKWTLLTTALLMRAIDQQQYHVQALEHLKKLQEVDALRKGYYKDLAAKWILEKLLNDWGSSNKIPATLELNTEAKIAFMYYAQYGVIADEILQPNSHESVTTFTNISLK